MQVCYDLRFPIFSRNRGDYDLAIYVANWPQGRQKVWDTLLSARAIENQAYVVGVNRVGSDANGQYAGGSKLVDLFGETIVKAEEGVESIVTGEIDLDRLKAFRKEFPVLDDADQFKLLVP